MKLLSFIGANGPTWGAVVGQDDVIDLGKEMPQHANLAAYIGSGDYLKAKDHVVGKTPAAKLSQITFLPVIGSKPNSRSPFARSAVSKVCSMVSWNGW